jgi:TetR/AcrR family transcriptional regulator, cholesterol catabolism regulator
VEPQEKIVAGAQELFFRYGIKSVTMDDIAKHLVVSKKTIYQYYPNKNKIVEAIMAKQLLADECHMQEMTSNSENVIMELISLIKHIRTMFAQMNPVIFYDLQKHHPAAWKLLMQFKANCIERMLSESLTKGINEGLVRSEINPKIIARVRTMEIEMGFSPDTFPPEEFNIAEVQIALIELFLHGICTLKGYQLIEQYKSIIENE